ncbi:MAG: hypothetical protein Q7J57_16605 [Gemmobacter sp.]|nr:hypothetical protein [Gemmobacter sp.]
MSLHEDQRFYFDLICFECPEMHGFLFPRTPYKFHRSNCEDRCCALRACGLIVPVPVEIRAVRRPHALHRPTPRDRNVIVRFAGAVITVTGLVICLLAARALDLGRPRIKGGFDRSANIVVRQGCQPIETVSRLIPSSARRS